MRGAMLFSCSLSVIELICFTIHCPCRKAVNSVLMETLVVSSAGGCVQLSFQFSVNTSDMLYCWTDSVAISYTGLCTGSKSNIEAQV